MPTYPYQCADQNCQQTFDVIKTVAEIERPETCARCGSKADRYIAQTHFYGASDWDRAEFNPGLGCVTRNRLHRDRIAKSRGLEEIGNECPSKMVEASDRAREQKLAKRWDSV